MDGEKNKEMTFDEWSSMWDKLFYLCEKRDDFRALLGHTLQYRSKWNRRK